MNIRPLIIDAEAKERIRKVKEYAEINFFTAKDIENFKNSKNIMAVGDNHNLCCDIHLGFRVVYSIMEYLDNDAQKYVWCRHMSVSVGNDMLPHPEAVKILMAEFGFQNPLNQCKVIVEDRKVINIVERVQEKN